VSYYYFEPSTHEYFSYEPTAISYSDFYSAPATQLYSYNEWTEEYSPVYEPSPFQSYFYYEPSTQTYFAYEPTQAAPHEESCSTGPAPGSNGSGLPPTWFNLWTSFYQAPTEQIYTYSEETGSYSPATEFWPTVAYYTYSE
jgi:hypothetical protein